MKIRAFLRILKMSILVLKMRFENTPHLGDAPFASLRKQLMHQGL
jgi:hypothetical protein